MAVFPGSDEIVDGKVPDGAYLLSGPSGAGKSQFCKQFVSMALKAGKPAIYVSVDERLERILEALKGFGIETDPASASTMGLRIIDCYSSRAGSPGGNSWVTSASPSNLSEVSIAISKAQAGLQGPRYVVDSITNLAVHSSPATALKFIQALVGKVRSTNGLGFFTLSPHAHDAEFVAGLRTLFDGIVEMKIDETGSVDIVRLMRAFAIKGAHHSPSWFPFKVTQSGLILFAENNPRCGWCGGVIEYEPYRETIEGEAYAFHAVECAEKYKARRKRGY